MTLLIENYIIRFKISEYYVSLVQVFDCQEDLPEVYLSSLLIESFIFVKSATHVSARGIIQNQEELFGSLEGKFETDNEWMSHISQHISLSLRIFNKVISHDLFLI